MKKPGYNPFSLISLGVGTIASTMALANSNTAPYAASIGTSVAAVLGGVELNDVQQTIQESIDSAIASFWENTSDYYNLTESCLNELKSELIDEGVPFDEFVANATNKGLSGTMDTIIVSILLKHREELEEENSSNADSKIKWDVLHTRENSKKISKELVTTIENAIRDNDLLKILVRMEKDRKSEKVEHDCLEKTVVDKGDQILKEIHKLYTTLLDSQFKDTSAHITDFRPYYELVKKRFTSKKRGIDKKLVGEYSDEKAYIDAFINVNEETVPVLSYLEEWFGEDNSGSLLIHGEPGHGKSLLCYKAMVDFYEGKFLKGVKNVLTVSLNTGDNTEITKDGKFNISSVLFWGEERHTFSFEDCRGALLFMDGFDECIDDLKKVGIAGIVPFMKKIEKIAFDYDIHIVVLSRTIAVAAYLKEAVIRDNEFKLMPITEQQQNDWLARHGDYNDYKETIKTIRENKDMGRLLGIPFLFRMIVHSRFDQVTNDEVDLYNKLVDHLMYKRNIHDDDLNQVIAELCNLAYDIYCNDADTVTIPKDKWDTRWIFAFYIKQTEKRIIGFYHNSFYQYFLAKFIFSHLLGAVTDKQAEELIGLLAERELDYTVRYYLSLMIKEESKKTIYNNLTLMIEALVRTEAYLNLESRYPTGKAEKKKIGRTINVYRNTLHICATFSYVIQMPFKDCLDIFLRLYPSSEIIICSDESRKACLSGAYLSGADLRRANLRGANLRRADLSRADLRGANLSGANLSGAYLSGAYLSGTDLSGADLSGADLRGADLSGADLSGADLRGADLRFAKLSRADLRGANLSGVFLYEVDLRRADLRGTILREVDLRRGHLRDTILSRVNLSGANLSRVDLSRQNLSGADLSGTNLSEAFLNEANLISANLISANLIRANLSGARLRGANLSGANLSGANLTGANLRKVHLKGARLREANLSGAFLREANLRRANLSGADLREVNLREADLKGANIEDANLNVKSVRYTIIDSGKKALIDSSIEGYETIVWID